MKKIAVIEDDSDLYSLLQYYLEKEGFTMVGSKTGKGALDLCRLERPDLVILDIMPPGITGLDLCRKLKGNAQLSSIPIIIISAKSEELDVVLGLELGADDYVAKPFSVKVLFSRIRAVLRAASAHRSLRCAKTPRPSFRSCCRRTRSRRSG